jgi:hypothetical protein
MDFRQGDTGSGTRESTSDIRTTRRAMLAAGGAVALGGLAGCSALDDLLGQAGEQVVGTTVSAPAAFYPGRAPPTGDADSDDDGILDADESEFYVGADAEVRAVPATVRAESQKIELEGWAISTTTKAQDYNASRSNKPSSEWWAGPDGGGDSDGDGYGDVLASIQDVELELLGHVRTAQDAVDLRQQDEARASLDAFIDATTKALKPELDKCGTGVCATIREHSDGRVQRIRTARDAVDESDWTTAAAELAAVEEINLGDIERIDDELEDSRPSRPRFSDLVGYLDGEATIGERFTVALPDAKLPGDNGSLAEQLTLDRVLAYFAASYEKEEGGRHTPFHNRYRPQFDANYDDGCIRIDGPVSIHEDLACQNLLSAKLDTYTTENRGIVGFGTEGGAVVSAAPASADTIGKRVFLATDDVTGEIILGEDRDMVMPRDNVSDSSQTLVCPVTVTAEDSPCPLPGLFFLRRIVHDDQIIFAGGWILDDGALYEDSATLLFDEGPSEVASVSPDDIESDDYDDRIIEQFSRDRSRLGSALISGTPEAIADSRMMPGPLGGILEGDSDEQMADGGGEEVDILGMGEEKVAASALDAPLVHLAGAKELSDEEKLIVPVAMDKGLR